MGGQERTGGDGAEGTGAGGRGATSSVYHKSPRGVVHKRHKEETNNLEAETDDSNQLSPSKKNVSVKDAIPSTSLGTHSTDARPPYSPYVAQVLSDFSNELQDSEHVVSNVTQALRLWQTSVLDEQEFVGLLYDAKTLTRKYQGKNGLRGIENKMAYFFRVLRGLIGEERTET